MNTAQSAAAARLFFDEMAIPRYDLIDSDGLTAELEPWDGEGDGLTAELIPCWDDGLTGDLVDVSPGPRRRARGRYLRPPRVARPDPSELRHAMSWGVRRRGRAACPPIADMSDGLTGELVLVDGWPTEEPTTPYADLTDDVSGELVLCDDHRPLSLADRAPPPRRPSPTLAVTPVVPMRFERPERPRPSLLDTILELLGLQRIEHARL